MRLRKLLCVLGVGLMVAALPASASAGSLRLRVDDLTAGSTQGVVLSDNALGDLSGADGTILWMGYLANGTLMQVTTGTSIHTPTTSTYSQLRLTELIVSSSGAANVRLTLEDRDFLAGANGETLGLVGQVGGTLVENFPTTTPSSISTQVWVNANNAVPNLGADTTGTAGADPWGVKNLSSQPIGSTPAGSVAAFDPVFVSGPGAFSSTDFSEFTVSGPFSLFAQTTINFTTAGNAAFTTNALVPVPEPGTLMLFGTGLLGIARAARRRRSAGNVA